MANINKIKIPGNTTEYEISTAKSLTFSNGGSGDVTGTTFDGSIAKTISYNTIGAAASGHTHSYAGSSSVGGAATSANKVNTAITFDNSGSGATSGTSFDGSVAKTISYNTIGASSSSHTHDYLPLTGGTVTGDLSVLNSSGTSAISIKNSTTGQIYMFADNTRKCISTQGASGTWTEIVSVNSDSTVYFPSYSIFQKNILGIGEICCNSSGNSSDSNLISRNTSGQIYLHTEPSSTGVNCLMASNASNSFKCIIKVDQSNNATFYGTASGCLPLSGGTMSGTSYITWADSGNWSNSNSGVTFPVNRGGLQWIGQSDGIKLFAQETASDNLDLVLQFTDDNSNGLSIRNSSGTQKAYIGATGYIYTNNQVYINYDNDVGLNQNGSLVIGTKAGQNLSFDSNEIMSRNNSAASTLYINNEGGTVQIGSGGLTVTGSIVTSGSINSTAGRITSTGNSSTEGQLIASGKAGGIFLYSQTSTTGNRGIWGWNASSTGSSILAVDQNNNVYLNGYSMFYQNGESVTFDSYYTFYGYTTSNSKAIHITIPMQKRLDNINSVTVNTFKANISNADGYGITSGYVEGGSNYVVSSVTISSFVKKNANQIELVLVKSSAFDLQNNDCVSCRTESIILYLYS